MASFAEAQAVGHEHPPGVIGIVVGEESGDMLGAGLMEALARHFPGTRFEGIGGPRMCALGFHSLFPQERLAVMGLIDPLKRLPELLRIRKSLKKHFQARQPRVFIGIDAPDFNLNLERYLRAQGIKTVHYVSPSVWAWRQGRVKTIAQAVDLMLTLLPFEKRFYDNHGVHAEFVGHPLADQIPLAIDRQRAADEVLSVSEQGASPIIALLPGSRGGEVERLAPIFLKAAGILQQRLPKALFVLPAANAARLVQIRALLAHYPNLSLRLVEGQSQQVMTAADVVMMASGTTSLEALLLKRPMVIAYRMAGLSFWLMAKMAKVRFVGLPNLLNSSQLVPELLQAKATPENLASAVLYWLENPREVEHLIKRFGEIHTELKRDASEQAALHIRRLVLA